MRNLQRLSSLVAQVFPASGEFGGFGEVLFTPDAQLGKFSFGGGNALFGLLSASDAIGQLFVGFGDGAVALLAVLFVAAQLIAQVVELLFAAGQFDLGGERVAIALVAGGIELVDAAGVIGHARFGLSQGGLQLVESSTGRGRAIFRPFRLVRRPIANRH